MALSSLTWGLTYLLAPGAHLSSALALNPSRSNTGLVLVCSCCLPCAWPNPGPAPSLGMCLMMWTFG